MTLDLRLRPTEIIAGEPLPDDWCVVLDGDTIGRIMRVQLARGVWVWSWSLILFPASPADRGDEPTLDAAKAAFRSRAEAVWPVDPRRMTRPAPASTARTHLGKNSARYLTSKD